MFRNRSILIALACVVLWAVRSEAQMCLGQTSFAGAPFQAGGGLALSSNTTNGLGTIARGTDTWFARGGIEFSKVSGIDGAGKGLAFQAGWAMPMVADRRVHFCPTFTLVDVFGVRPFQGLSVSELVFAAGGSFGFDAGRRGPLHLVPTLGLNVGHTRESYHYSSRAFFQPDDISETAFVIQAGV